MIWKDILKYTYYFECEESYVKHYMDQGLRARPVKQINLGLKQEDDVVEFQITDGRVYYQDEKSEVLAQATYSYVSEGVVDIDHTYVSPVLRGQGIAGKLMEALASDLRAKGLKATASCSYAEAWLEKNRENYGDIIA